MEDSAKTPRGKPKIEVGYAAAQNYSSLRGMWNHLVAEGLELFCRPPTATPGDPIPVDTFRVIPPFAEEPPNQGLLLSETTYREPIPAGAAADAVGRILLGSDLMPMRATVTGSPPVITPPMGADPASGFMLSLTEAANIGKMAKSQFDSRKATAEDYQKQFDKFKGIVAAFVTAETITLLEEEYFARNPRRIFSQIVSRVNQANDPGLTNAIDSAAQAIDWGVAETLTHYLRRKQDMWDNLHEMGETWTDAKKKNHILKVLTHVTGAAGPYMITIERIRDDDAMSYSDAKSAILKAETRVQATNGNNKAYKGKEPDCIESWQPYDGRKAKTGNWVYDPKRAEAYLDPRAYYTTNAVTKGHAMAADAGRSSSAKSSGKTKAGGKPSGGKSASRTPDCRYCPGQQHRIYQCPNVVQCWNPSCQGWRHRKGTPCDNGAERRERLARLQANGRATNRGPQATAHSASVEQGPLPKVPDATPAQPPPQAMIAGMLPAEYANLVTQQAATIQRQAAINQRLTNQLRTNRTASHAAAMYDDYYDDMEDTLG